MGSAVWIEIYHRPLKETADDCCKMVRLSKQLDNLAARLGVPKLSTFFDYSEMARVADAEMRALEMDGDTGDKMDEEDSCDVTAESLSQREATGEWFDSARGLMTIRALLQHLAKHADAVALPTDSVEDFNRYRKEMLEEFQLCERHLKEAESCGKQFRLLIVP